MKEQVTFSTEEVQRYCDLTARQLQWWDERKVISPVKKTGHRRQYSLDNLFVVAVIADLKRAGLSLQAVRRLLKKLDLGARYAITDGKRITAASTDEQVIAELKSATRGSFLIDLGEIRRGVLGIVASKAA